MSHGNLHLRDTDSTANLPTTYEEAMEWLKGKRKRRVGRSSVWVDDAHGEVRVSLYDTTILTLRPDGSRTISSGGHMTMSTRTWLGRFGVCVVMGGGIPSVIHSRGGEIPFVDGMTLSVPTFSHVKYPEGFKPVGTVAQIRSRRRRMLARLSKGDLTVPVSRWDTRSGGKMWMGTPWETFHSDEECGLMPRRKGTIVDLLK